MIPRILIAMLFIFTSLTNVIAQQTTPNKIVVAQDGSGNFKTIQEAVNSVRDHMQTRVTIEVKAGTYAEKLVIPAWKKNITLIGESKENTIITNADYSGKAFPTKDFTGNPKYSTYTSYTVLVQGNDCRLENLTIENTAGTVGQAVALTVEADRFAARNCAFLGNQDTLYTSRDGRNYFESCFIVGTTDFIFGEATVVFSKCTIKSLSNSYITAASTTKEQRFGYVFLDCDLIAAPTATKVFLGRPWRPFAKTVFIRCNLGSHIIPAGWNAWPGDPMFADKDKTAFYAEYANTGAGSATAERVPWSKQLTGKQAKAYTLKNIFGSWNPEF
ncbi:pectinesterase family protein [Pedobacter frigiditerrae]|uniref:pectinesterase family protein n=1 Tax=Pedobacter frigiditerrae TaxID=2530452 RepID=UPI0029307EED|nr:pectinesterase family protein [Pedobacter frigiditerrae]